MDVLSHLKSFFRTSSTTIDNYVFRLHKVTFAILIGCSILVTARQYVGNPISCISGDDIPTNLLDTYCWIHTTFSLPDAWHKKVGEEVPYPGVDKYTPGEDRVYHAYYQWVCFVLFLQAILFYIPRYFWKTMEGGRINDLILGLNSPILSEDTKRNNRKTLVSYMASNFHNHGTYFTSFVLAEIMNFVNVVGQMFLMNAFLGGEFTSYGIKVLQFSNWDWSVRYDPMIKVFPRLTKCTFHRYGSSGDVQRHDAMCILPINIINEKIYLILWFWFVIVAILSGAALVYRVAIFYSSRFRYEVTRRKAHLSNGDQLKFVLNRCMLGDWFLLYLLSKNLDPTHFRDVISDFARKIGGSFKVMDEESDL